jgi:hypothetical protein
VGTELFLGQTNPKENSFHLIGSSTKAKELSGYLIQAFTPLSSHQRDLFANNAFMVGSQLTEVLGKEKYEFIQKDFGEMDWKIAWKLFDRHFYRVRGEE